MPRKSKNDKIQCKHFNWLLFKQNEIWYADGRCRNKFNLGKNSLGTKNIHEALKEVHELDLAKAIEHGLAQPDQAPTNQNSKIEIEAGWQELYAYAGRGEMLGGVSEGSLKRYQNCGKNHSKYCKDRGIKCWNDFSDTSLSKYAKHLKKRYAPPTVYSFLLLVKMANRRLIENGMLPEGLLLKSKLSRPQGTDRYCFTSVEISAMVEFCLNNPGLEWMGQVILVLAHTGLRVSEFLNLRKGDIDMRSETILVADERSSHMKTKQGTARRTKSSKSRRIPIHPGITETLLLILKNSTDGVLFRNAKGEQLNYYHVRNTLKNRVITSLKDQFPTPKNEIGFEHGVLHSFRHFFCSQSLISGASEGEIKVWLGHSDSRMVERYRHLRDVDSLRRMKQLTFLDQQGAKPPTGNAIVL